MLISFKVLVAAKLSENNILSHAHGSVIFFTFCLIILFLIASFIPSFKIEIAPLKAVCELQASNGAMIESECLQYRQTYQKNYTPLNGNIQGFTYEPNYRYVLDVRQEAMMDEVTNAVKPVWILNQVVSKKAE